MARDADQLRKAVFNGLLGALGFSMRRTPPGAGATYNVGTGRWSDRQRGFGTAMQRSWLPSSGRYAAAKPVVSTSANGMGGSTIQSGQGAGFSAWAKDNRNVNRSGQRPFNALQGSLGGAGNAFIGGFSGSPVGTLNLSAPMGALRKDASAKAARRLLEMEQGRQALLRGTAGFVADTAPKLRGAIAGIFGARKGIVQESVGGQRGVVQWGQHDRASGKGFGLLHSTVGRIDKDGLSLDEAKAMHDALPGIRRDRRLVDSFGSRAVFSDGRHDAVFDNRHGPEHFITMYPLDGAKAARRKLALGKRAPGAQGRDPELEAAYFAAMRPAKDGSAADRKAAWGRLNALMDARGGSKPDAPDAPRTLSAAEHRQRVEAARSAARKRGPKENSKGQVSTLYQRGASVEAEESFDAGPGPKSMYVHLRQTPRVPTAMDGAKGKELLAFAGQRTKERLDQLRAEVLEGKHDALIRRRKGDNGTPLDPKVVGMALNHARNLALHDIGVADLGFRLKEEHHAPLKAMVPLIWHARRSMVNTLRQEKPGQYHAWRKEFGAPFAKPKFYERGTRSGAAEGHQQGEEKKRFYRHQVLIKAAEADALGKAVFGAAANALGGAARMAGRGASAVAAAPGRWAARGALAVARGTPGALWSGAKLGGRAALGVGRMGLAAARGLGGAAAAVGTRAGRARFPRSQMRQALMQGRPERLAAVNSAERLGAFRAPVPAGAGHADRLVAMGGAARDAGVAARGQAFGTLRGAARQRAMNYAALRNTGIGAAAAVGALGAGAAMRQHGMNQRVQAKRQARLDRASAGLAKADTTAAEDWSRSIAGNAGGALGWAAGMAGSAGLAQRTQRLIERRTAAGAVLALRHAKARDAMAPVPEMRGYAGRVVRAQGRGMGRMAGLLASGLVRGGAAFAGGVVGDAAADVAVGNAHRMARGQEASPDTRKLTALGLGLGAAGGAVAQTVTEGARRFRYRPGAGLAAGLVAGTAGGLIGERLGEMKSAKAPAMLKRTPGAPLSEAELEQRREAARKRDKLDDQRDGRAFIGMGAGLAAGVPRTVQSARQIAAYYGRAYRSPMKRAAFSAMLDQGKRMAGLGAAGALLGYATQFAEKDEDGNLDPTKAGAVVAGGLAAGAAARVGMRHAMHHGLRAVIARGGGAQTEHVATVPPVPWRAGGSLRDLAGHAMDLVRRPTREGGKPTRKEIRRQFLRDSIAGRERMLALDFNGRVVLNEKGGAVSVGGTHRATSVLNGASRKGQLRELLHNHPGASSPSQPDANLADVFPVVRHRVYGFGQEVGTGRIRHEVTRFDERVPGGIKNPKIGVEPMHTWLPQHEGWAAEAQVLDEEGRKGAYRRFQRTARTGTPGLGR